MQCNKQNVLMMHFTLATGIVHLYRIIQKNGKTKEVSVQTNSNNLYQRMHSLKRKANSLLRETQ